MSANALTVTVNTNDMNLVAALEKAQKKSSSGFLWCTKHVVVQNTTDSSYMVLPEWRATLSCWCYPTERKLIPATTISIRTDGLLDNMQTFFNENRDTASRLLKTFIAGLKTLGAATGALETAWQYIKETSHVQSVFSNTSEQDAIWQICSQISDKRPQLPLALAEHYADLLQNSQAHSVSDLTYSILEITEKLCVDNKVTAARRVAHTFGIARIGYEGGDAQAFLKDLQTATTDREIHNVYAQHFSNDVKPVVTSVPSDNPQRPSPIPGSKASIESELIAADRTRKGYTAVPNNDIDPAMLAQLPDTSTI